MRFLLDTSSYLEFLNDSDAAERAAAVLREIAPYLHLSAVVRAELTQGAKGKAGRALVDKLARPFERCGRVVTPAYEDWVTAATAQSKLWDESPSQRTKKLLFDLLLACSARRIGAWLVTENERDFQRIDRWLPTKRLRIADLLGTPRSSR